MISMKTGTLMKIKTLVEISIENATITAMTMTIEPYFTITIRNFKNICLIPITIVPTAVRLRLRLQLQGHLL